MKNSSSQVDRRHFMAATATVGAAGLAAISPARAKESERIERPGNTPNTKFAVNVEMWFGNRPFLEKIQLASEMGFPAIEFWPYENKPIQEAAKLLKDRGVAVSQFTAWGFGTKLNNPNFNHQEFVKKIEQSCDVADEIDCDLFTVVVGNDIPGRSKSEMHAAAIKGLKMAAPICEQRKKTMIIEPMNPRDHPKHCLYGSSDAIKICKAVGSPSVKINWDLYHMQIVEGDLCMKMREGFDYIGYLQLADNPGRHEPGTGEINYTRVFEEIKALHYSGYVGLECRPKEGEHIAASRIYQADTF